MSALTPFETSRGLWSPRRELVDLEKRLSTFFRRPSTENREKEIMKVTEWSPLVDISEDDKEYVVKAELPEIKKEEVKVTVLDNVLCITGERKKEMEEKGKRYHRIEREYGSFMRSFALPDDADGSKVNAEYKDGILKVHLPKSEKAKPKSVEVKVS
jgi:HSP20 family protein